MEASPQNSTEQPKAFRLRSVTARLKDILLESTRKIFWVRAQLVPDKGNRRSGHFFGELVDVDDNGQTVARMRVVIWRAEYETVKQKLINDGQPDALDGNREICALCSVRFHAVYGLQLQIFDVDPNFRESHLDRNRRQILEKLQKEGLLEKNKATVLPAAPLRIGLITSANSAACADFTKTLGGSPFAFRVLLAPCAMQGQGTSRDVVSAITALVHLHADVICVVRGGGSPLDLAWFDHEAIGHAIACCPVPVWVGIGHELDITVPGFVAHARHKTPTAVAEALVERIRALDSDLFLARARLVEGCDRCINLAERSIEQNRNGFQQGSRKHLQIHTERFSAKVANLAAALDARVAGHAAQLGQGFIQLQERIRGSLDLVAQGLRHADRRLSDTVTRRLEQGAEVNAQKLNGLVDGARKHFDMKRERFRRWVVTLQGTLDKTFNDRLALLATAAVLLQERTRGRQDSRERELGQHTSELLAAFTWAVDARNNILELKTTGFNLTHYERVLDLTLKSLQEKGKRVSALDPEQLLFRGYSITRDESGNIIRSADKVQAGHTIRTQLAKGALSSVVVQKEERDE
jgi:exodeoxyribonuclease VII large subunit